MSQPNEHVLEVQEELIKLGIITDESILISYEQIVGGGASCILFELCFENPSIKLIQKIDQYSNTADHIEDYEINVKFEFANMKILFENGMNVPKPYFLKLLPNSRNLPYYVMEKIEGRRLGEVKAKNLDMYEQLIEILLQELIKIHEIDPNLFPHIPIEEINKNPYSTIEEKLRVHRIYLNAYPEELKELRPIIEWLEENKKHHPCEKPVITHGDIHSFNIFVSDNNKFTIIDLGSVGYRDFRIDISYAAIPESYFDGNQTFEERFMRVSFIVSKYEQLSGRKVEGLEYFIILGCVFNFIRLYGAINNPKITGVTDDAIDFYWTVSDYFLFLAEFIEETLKIELSQVKEYFKEK